MVVGILNQPNNVYLKETFCEGLHSRLNMAILGMPRTMIVKVVNLMKTMEGELMPSKKYSNKVQDKLKSEIIDYDSDEKP